MRNRVIGNRLAASALFVLCGLAGLWILVGGVMPSASGAGGPGIGGGSGISFTPPQIKVPSVPKSPNGINLSKTPEWSNVMKDFGQVDQLLKQGTDQITKQVADQMLGEFSKNLKGLDQYKGKGMITENTVQMLNDEFAAALRKGCPELAQKQTDKLLNQYQGKLKDIRSALTGGGERPGLRPGKKDRPGLAQLKEQFAKQTQALNNFAELRRRLQQVSTAKAEGQLNQWMNGSVLKAIEEDCKALNSLLEESIKIAEELMGENLITETLQLVEEVCQACVETEAVVEELASGTYTEVDMPDDAQEVPITRHYRGAENCVFDKRADVIVQTSEEWKDLWREIRGKDVSPPPFDEKKETALCAFYGPQDTMEYSISIPGVYRQGDELIAVVEVSHVSDADEKKQNSPYYIAIIQRFEGTISFAETE
ncbi:MAG: hypothetical protein RDV41_13115 [Planctomycetota bacterium]|nr:hypothetical protein [Planctomycetota bacterium]